MLRMKKHDHAAFRELYDLTLPFVYSVVNDFCRQLEKAEDIVQEVYFDIWRQRYSLDENLSLIGLLKIITQRKLWRHIESYKRTAMIDYVPPGITHSCQLIEEKENDSLLLTALSLLPERQKEIFLLTKSGLSADEISKRLKISKRTAENHLFRARENIVKYLRKTNAIF